MSIPGLFDNPSGLLWPVLAHLLLVQFLFVMVSIRRMQAAKDSEFELDELAHTGREPERSRRWARNLDNQFQLPMLFYVLAAILLMRDEAGPIQIALAWVFVAGRYLHTAIQTQTDNVALRGQVFVINYAALSLMWLLFIARSFAIVP